MSNPEVIEGTEGLPADASFGIVVSRFNQFVTDALLEGALKCLAEHGVPAARIKVARVPGAWELPLACKRFCDSGKIHGVIALGAVIRGGTPHFDYVAGEAARGCSAVMLETGVPVTFGVLTTDTVDQAIDRAGGKAGNKGADAALAAIEMVTLGQRLKAQGV